MNGDFYDLKGITKEGEVYYQQPSGQIHNFPARGVQETESQRLRHPYSTIIRGAAANAPQNFPGTLRHGVDHHLPSAPAAGAPGITFLGA